MKSLKRSNLVLRVWRHEGNLHRDLRTWIEQNHTQFKRNCYISHCSFFSMWFRDLCLHFYLKYEPKNINYVLKARDDVYVSLFQRKFSQNMTSLFCIYRCSFINYYDKKIFNQSTNEKNFWTIGPFICSAVLRATKILFFISHSEPYICVFIIKGKKS